MLGNAAMIAVLLAPTASIARQDDHRTAAKPAPASCPDCATILRALVSGHQNASDPLAPINAYTN
jgi:hypothetical protein